MSSESVQNDSTNKVNLLGLTRQQMEDFFESIGEKRFRAHQVMKWIHFFGADDFEAMERKKMLSEALKLLKIATPRGSFATPRGSSSYPGGSSS